MQIIYIEKSIINHIKTQEILEKYNNKKIIICNNYREVFNKKSQNFRIQKQKPALILAEKTGNLVLPTPEGFGIGSEKNYYFSHMLNCLYDCRYCFLQAMYPSANYVLFVNYNDFMIEIKKIINQHPNQPIYFFSGYDCDSLAFEPMTGFLKAFLPFFSKQKNAILEIRTKSSNVRELLKHDSFANCITAFSLTPEQISKQTEFKVPSMNKRLLAMQLLAKAGWKIGLRFDPLIYASNFDILYQQLIDEIFQYIKPKNVHSVAIGPMRFPEKMYQKIVKLYPKEKLLAHPLQKRNCYYSYSNEREKIMKNFVLSYLQNYLDKALLFECNSL